ncbi:MAG TPA: DUF421 domain-containing protein [Bacilli bacterium]
MNLMELWNEIWKSSVLIIIGMFLLRLAGRKSISQMTVPTTVIMVSIGTVIVQPIANKSIWMAVAAAAVFILILITVEISQVKWNHFEKVFRGSSVIVIRDGKLLPEDLKKIRLTVDQLEMKLRQASISRISDVKTATIETNGQLGYELIEDAKPVTLNQIKDLLVAYFPSNGLVPDIDVKHKHKESNSEDINLFQELKHNQRHINDDHLQ